MLVGLFFNIPFLGGEAKLTIDNQRSEGFNPNGFGSNLLRESVIDSLLSNDATTAKSST